METASVLISEAEPDVRRLLVLLVERRGHAAVAFDPNAAAPPHADVLLLDPDAPSGPEQARLVRARYPDVAVVFLPKPFSPDQLDALLERALA